MKKGVAELNGPQGRHARAAEARRAGIDRIGQALDGHVSQFHFEQSGHKSC